MKKIGITGGIGSGKTTVTEIFAKLGVPVYYDDIEARELQNTDLEVVEKIKKEFGQDLYEEGSLNRSKLASIVFSDPEKLKVLNSIVHPAARKKWNEWVSKQDAPYVLREAAIMFESGADEDMDSVLGVFAPLELRIERVMKRNSLTREQVIERINAQMNEQEKMSMCKILILNDESSIENLEKQVEFFHKIFTNI